MAASPMPATSSRTYNDAIQSLNGLQSNFAILSAIKVNRMAMNAQAIPEMLEWVRRMGYETPALFDPLNIIHVAGTKGKGSTSAFASSILSAYQRAGLLKKTGLYTSPHLRAVRERIQIDGKPLSEEMFATYFFDVWDRLEASAKTEGRDPTEKPVYFRFLTLIAFHAYVTEGVDSAVFEVGIGGEFDSTNVIEKPTVAGITALGIDHVHVLGETIEEIAWHKAGIFKPGASAFSVIQHEGALKVVKERATEKGIDLEVVDVHPDIENGSVKLGLSAEFQKQNASLAAAMVGAHMKKLGHTVDIRPGKPLPNEIREGLETVELLGRYQVIQEGQLEWNIDGAHTIESLDVAGKWFGARAIEQPHKTRVLIFNQQNRDTPEKLAGALGSSLKKALGRRAIFSHAIFCTNVTYKDSSYKADLMNAGSDSKAIQELTVQKSLAKAWNEVDTSARTHTVATIEDAIFLARSLEGETQVLVTGSLHLVGGILEVLEN